MTKGNEDKNMGETSPNLGGEKHSETDEGKKPALTPVDAPKSGVDLDQPKHISETEYRRRFEEAAFEFGTDAFIFKRLEILKEHNVPAALFLGVRQTGKTWLMQRMKDKLSLNYTCRPPLPKFDKPISSAAVQNHDREKFQEDALNETSKNDILTAEERMKAAERAAGGETGRSGQIVFHRFTSLPGSFALIDVPGERIEQLGDDNYTANRGLIAALNYASVIIVALPADVVLLGDRYLDEQENDGPEFQRFSDDVEHMEGFIDGIATIAAVRSLVQHEGIELKWKDPATAEDDFDRKITTEAVEAHQLARGVCTPIGGIDGKNCPAFFALTKADRIFAVMDILPDSASADIGARPRFTKAHNDIRNSPEGVLLQDLYKDSQLNSQNRNSDSDFVSKLANLFSAPVDPVTEISSPPDLVKTFNPKLFNRLTDYMPMSRFDLISAFYGNTKTSLERKDFKRMDSVGVSELIAWLGQVHDRGTNHWHVWARSVFRRVYGSSRDAGGVFGGAGRHSFSKRLKWTPRSILKRLFRKEWHPVQLLPVALGIIGVVFMSWVSFDWAEQTGKIADGRLYKSFAAAIGPEGVDVPRTSGTKVDKSFTAIALLPPPPTRLSPSNADKLRLWPVEDLRDWEGDDSFDIPSDFNSASTAPPELPNHPELANELNYLRLGQIEWQDRYVCGLEGWGMYRPIVRKAVIRGYGDCSAVEVALLRSPAIEKFGLLGVALLVIGWMLVAGAFVYNSWLQKTRVAYAFLYHSNVATTERPIEKNSE